MSSRLIFISYSQKDKKWKEALEEQLGVLEQQGSLEVWSDTDIGGGEDWEQKIEDALRNACVAILLVSGGSLNSKFILKEEMKRLLQRRDQEGLRIFPIIARDCNWQEVEWLRRMQVRPRDGSPLQGKSAAQRTTELKNIVFEITKIVAAAADLELSGASESRPAVQERARSETSPQATGIELEQALKAERDRGAAKLREIDRQLKDLKRSSRLQGSPTSKRAVGDQASSAKEFGRMARDTTKAEEAGGEVSAKKGE